MVTLSESPCYSEVVFECSFIHYIIYIQGVLEVTHHILLLFYVSHFIGYG